MADFVSVDTQGWFSVTILEAESSSATMTSANYLNYQDIPNEHITKCGIAYPAIGYAGSYNNERELIDVMVTEAYNKHGVCMDYYITSYSKTYDKVWGEDSNRQFTRMFKIMGFFNLPREERLWSKFGIEGMDNISLYISKRHFWEASKYDDTQTNPNAFEPYFPKVGDYIMAKYNKYIYEVVEVKDEVMMHLLSKQHVWELIVRPFKDEHIATTSATSGTDIAPYTNKSSDKFDITSTIDEIKEDVNYNPPGTECDPNDIAFGSW